MEPLLDKNLILNTLQSHKKELKGFGVKRIGIFGSYSNNKSNPDSDIDLLVELRMEKKTFKDFMALNYFLENLFQKKVDLLTEKSLSPHIGPHILNSVEYVSFTN